MCADSLEIIDILDPAGKDEFRNLIGEEKIILLVGSKVSEWYPSSLPSGMEVTRQISELLADQISNVDEQHKQKVVGFIRRAPFEYIIDRCPRQQKVKLLLARLYRSNNPNLVHRAIANLVCADRIHSVITPNYDMCLEAVLPDKNPLRHIVLPKHLEGITHGDRVLFKIHGSAQAGLESTMVVSLSEEGRLPEWKQTLLRDIIEGKYLLVMGFSGLDFEISPYIVQSKPKKVIWNSYRNPTHVPQTLSPNARRILSTCPSVVVWGDLRHLLAEMDKPFVWYNTFFTLRVDELLRQELTLIDLKLWSAAVLSPPGYAYYAKLLAYDLMRSLSRDDSEYTMAVNIYGDALYSQGKYLDSAHYTEESSRLFLTHGDISNFIRSETRGIDALRCAGLFKEAYQRLEIARQTLSQLQCYEVEKEQLTAKLDLQEVLLIRERYSRAKVLYQRGIFSRKMRNRMRECQVEGKQLLQNVVEISEKYGQWHDIQQSRMWSGRLDISFNEVYDGPLKPLDDMAGWSHLGYIVPEMMSLREALLKGEYDKAPEATVRGHILLAKEIGCEPEVWKLTLSLWKHYGWRLSDFHFDWLKAFIRCQYNIVMRLFKLWAEEYR